MPDNLIYRTHIPGIHLHHSMSNGIGRGGNSLKRSPPRQAEDRDSTVILRSTRGTGLPPRILSSGRGRGGLGIGRGIAKGAGMRAWPVVRPQSGSVPPWANRKMADTYIPNRAPIADERREEEAGKHGLKKESPTQPKWDRESSRTPIPSSRMMSSSPPSGPRDNGSSLGYSAGPSHQRWMAPGEQAGPSRYSVPEPREERELVVDSTISSPPTSRAEPTNPNPQTTSTSDIPESSKRKSNPEPVGHVRETNHQPRNMRGPDTYATQDEKEDSYMDTPGAGPSRSPQTVPITEDIMEQDIKPDLSTLEEEELPSIPDEDREDGVLAVK
jgi:hypothetical protein